MGNCLPISAVGSTVWNLAACADLLTSFLMNIPIVAIATIMMAIFVAMVSFFSIITPCLGLKVEGKQYVRALHQVKIKRPGLVLARQKCPFEVLMVKCNTSYTQNFLVCSYTSRVRNHFAILISFPFDSPLVCVPRQSR